MRRHRKHKKHRDSNNNMKIRDILTWLCIFVIGSLIVTFIVNPGYRESVIENTKELFSVDSRIDVYQKIRPPQETKTRDDFLKDIETYLDSESQPEKELFRKGSMYQCELIEFIEFQNTIENPREALCKGPCLQMGKEYYSSACEREWHICYCVDGEKNE